MQLNKMINCKYDSNNQAKLRFINDSRCKPVQYQTKISIRVLHYYPINYQRCSKKEDYGIIFPIMKDFETLHSFTEKAFYAFIYQQS